MSAAHFCTEAGWAVQALRETSPFCFWSASAHWPGRPPPFTKSRFFGSFQRRNHREQRLCHKAGNGTGDSGLSSLFWEGRARGEYFRSRKYFRVSAMYRLLSICKTLVNGASPRTGHFPLLVTTSSQRVSSFPVHLKLVRFQLKLCQALGAPVNKTNRPDPALATE